MSNAPIKSPPDKSPAFLKDDGGAAGASSTTASKLPRSRFVVYFTIALCGFAADWATKFWAFRWLGLPDAFVAAGDPANLARWRGDPSLPHRWWLIEGRLGIESSVNRGALFGFGEGYWWLFALLSVVALIGIVTWLFAYRAARDRWLTVALGFVSGGILGNLHDRLGIWDATGLRTEFHHGVRDWILFVWPEIKLQMFNPWPNFNIADSLLVSGAIMLVVHALVWRDANEHAESRAPAAARAG